MSPAVVGAENAFLGECERRWDVSALYQLSLGPDSPHGLNCLNVMLSYSSGLCLHRSIEHGEREGPNFVCMFSRLSACPGLELLFLCA